MCVTNNGHASEFFQTNRGIRQGCPISALHFLLVVESLADKIRSSKNIAGIDIDGVTITISQLADDTTLFLKDKMSVVNVFTMLKHFEMSAGLKLNKEKSEIIILGSDTDCNICTVCGVHVVQDPIKVLGIWITKDTDKISDINFKERIEKLSHLLNMWKQRKLTLKGKVTIVNSLALSQIMYVASVLYVPPDVIEEVNKLMLNFLWKKKVHVKHSTVVAPISCGGLRMPDFAYKVKASKVMWIKRLLSNDTLAHLATVFGLPLKFNAMCHFDFNMKFLPGYGSQFYMQILDAWYALRKITCTTADHIRSQCIWYNVNILVNQEPIFIKNLYNKELLLINDILNDEGRFLSLIDLNEKFKCNVNVMTYNSIKDAIPMSWRYKVKGTKTSTDSCMDLKVKIGTLAKDVFD